MRSAPLARTAIPLCVLLVACVEQDDDKPTAEDMAVAKQNILTTPPTPKYAVNADLDGKIVYLGPRRRPRPDRAGQGRHADALLEARVAARPGLEDIHAPQRRRSKSFINADHAPVKGKYPVGAWKAGEIIRDQHTIRLPRELGGADGRGLRRAVARARRACRSRPGPHDAEGRVLAATIPVEREAGRAERAQALRRAHGDQGAQDRRQARRRRRGRRRRRRARSSTRMTGAPVAQKTEAKLLWDKKFLYVAHRERRLRTCGRSWTSATTSCGPRRRTRS